MDTPPYRIGYNEGQLRNYVYTTVFAKQRTTYGFLLFLHIKDF
ncbi:hypothetical protein MNV_660011 [Candidatus Methanoperedens nitroreducens]|uniref:Uncharacterized protein n=1 Tax=Candidatus Methanoperedens nitratireducens TaxID=1392998 RepID=A0A284VSV9_9EURY|nr:hypothetical protein MNV_660011 [Candidatus Methanoperedens nitroreducens]